MISLRYCAVGDYGIEADFGTEKECQDWIEQQKLDAGDDLDDYYTIQTYTQPELDAMPEAE